MGPQPDFGPFPDALENNNFIPPDLDVNVNVKKERVKKEVRQEERSAAFDVLVVEKESPLLCSKLKSTFNVQKPDDFCVTE